MSIIYKIISFILFDIFLFFSYFFWHWDIYDEYVWYDKYWKNDFELNSFIEFLLKSFNVVKLFDILLLLLLLLSILFVEYMNNSFF